MVRPTESERATAQTRLLEICVCGHPRSQHGRHEDVVSGVLDDRRELCMECPGYVLELEDGSEIDGYPRGAAWHRFREA